MTLVKILESTRCAGTFKFSKNSGFSDKNNETTNKSNICLEEGGKRGLCNGALAFWYFNQNTKRCESFIYGGCEAGSSENKFVTKELCEQTCTN